MLETWILSVPVAEDGLGRELEYRLIEEQAFHGNRIAVRFAHESGKASGE